MWPLQVLRKFNWMLYNNKVGRVVDDKEIEKKNKKKWGVNM